MLLCIQGTLSASSGRGFVGTSTQTVRGLPVLSSMPLRNLILHFIHISHLSFHIAKSKKIDGAGMICPGKFAISDDAVCSQFPRSPLFQLLYNPLRLSLRTGNNNMDMIGPDCQRTQVPVPNHTVPPHHFVHQVSRLLTEYKWLMTHALEFTLKSL